MKITREKEEIDVSSIEDLLKADKVPGIDGADTYVLDIPSYQHSGIVLLTREKSNDKNAVILKADLQMEDVSISEGRLCYELPDKENLKRYTIKDKEFPALNRAMKGVGI